LSLRSEISRFQLLYLLGQIMTPLIIVQPELVVLRCVVAPHWQAAPLLQPHTHWDEHGHDLLVLLGTAVSRCFAITMAQAAEPCCLGSVAWAMVGNTQMVSSTITRSQAGGR
jgi:hypothetical protein